MELSYFLAQLIGLTVIIFASVALLQPTFIAAAIRDIRPFSFSLLVAGLIGIVAGLAIVLTHNVWEASWRVVITLMGWAALVKGIAYLVFPESLMRTAVNVFEGKRQRVVLIVSILFGCYLVYHGFGA